MNIKVVVFWSIAVAFFLIVGLFGYFNRDLIIKEIIDPEAPVVPEVNYESKKCMVSTDDGTITYTFRINPETGSIERLFINYDAAVENIDIYESAAAINTAVNSANTIKGINSQMYGNANDLTLNLNVNLLDYDKDKIQELNGNLRSVGFIVEGITDYNSYKSTINGSLNKSFDCD